MKEKVLNALKYYRDDNWIDKNIPKGDLFDYSDIDSLRLYDSTHPAVMIERINTRNWKFDHDISRNKVTAKERVKRFMKKHFGWNLDYQNYIVS